MNAPIRLTEQLAAWRSGDGEARAALDREIYATLKRMAVARAGGHGAVTLNPTALVAEAVIRLLDGAVDWQSRAHFYALAALQMRAVLVDHARRVLADKRGGGVARVTLDDRIDAAGPEPSAVDLLDLHEALEALAVDDARTARVVELTYFGGLKAREVAEVLELGVTTIEGELAYGRAWLKRRLAT